MLTEVKFFSDKVKKGFSDDGRFLSDKYRSVYSLHINDEKISPTDIFRMCFHSAFLMYALSTRSNLFGIPSSDISWLKMAKNINIKFIGGLIIHHLQILNTNFHTIREIFDNEMTARGYGIYPFLSILNHSCDPSVFRIYHPEHAIARITQPIKKDQQVFECYGPCYEAMEKNMRQKIMDLQFGFKCNCVACINDWPVVENLLGLNTSSPKLDVNLEKVVQKLHKMFYKYVHYDDVTINLYTLRKLLKMNATIWKYATKPCKECSMATTLLKNMFNHLGNRFDIPNVQDAK